MWLTLTLDVFKHARKSLNMSRAERLTLTLDVFKHALLN